MPGGYNCIPNLFQISNLFPPFDREVTQRSLDLPHELYKTSWVDWNKDSRRIVLLFMQRLHSTLRIRTLNPSLGFDLMLFSSVGYFCRSTILCTVANFHNEPH